MLENVLSGEAFADNFIQQFCGSFHFGLADSCGSFSLFAVYWHPGKALINSAGMYRLKWTLVVVYAQKHFFWHVV